MGRYKHTFDTETKDGPAGPEDGLAHRELLDERGVAPGAEPGVTVRGATR